jgi:hypothetical protein
VAAAGAVDEPAGQCARHQGGVRWIVRR